MYLWDNVFMWEQALISGTHNFKVWSALRESWATLKLSQSISLCLPAVLVKVKNTHAAISYACARAPPQG